MAIDSLLEKGVEPPRDWIWMDVWTPGISFFPDVSNRISKHIEKDGAEALRIFQDESAREEAGLDDPKHGLLESEISALMAFHECDDWQPYLQICFSVATFPRNKCFSMFSVGWNTVLLSHWGHHCEI